MININCDILNLIAGSGGLSYPCELQELQRMESASLERGGQSQSQAEEVDANLRRLSV